MTNTIIAEFLQQNGIKHDSHVYSEIGLIYLAKYHYPHIKCMPDGRFMLMQVDVARHYHLSDPEALPKLLRDIIYTLYHLTHKNTDHFCSSSDR